MALLQCLLFCGVSVVGDSWPLNFYVGMVSLWEFVSLRSAALRLPHLALLSCTLSCETSLMGIAWRNKALLASNMASLAFRGIFAAWIFGGIRWLQRLSHPHYTLVSAYLRIV